MIIRAKDIMHVLKKDVEDFDETVDTIKTGDGEKEVKTVVVTFLATVEVIKRAIELNADMIITHEPTFYNHMDDIEGLKDDPVYEYKRRLLDGNDITLMRYHDYIHSLKDDGIYLGVNEKLGWTQYVVKNDMNFLGVYDLPETTAGDIAQHLKAKLGCDMLRLTGDKDLKVKSVCFAIGASGGESHIKMINMIKPDLMMCGELNEWETPIYIMDAISKGEKIALLTVGHNESEKDGMVWLKHELIKRFPSLNVEYIKTPKTFEYI